ncbi:MAG: hypothetical protein MdMp014T_2306 [Treponematales bacterium]
MAWRNRIGETGQCSVCDAPWKDHWIGLKGEEWPRRCSVRGCHNEAEVGAHIYRENAAGTYYIVPMCRKHNNPAHPEPFELKDDQLAVPEDHDKALSDPDCDDLCQD